MQKNKKLTRILCAILALTLILSIIGSLCSKMRNCRKEEVICL